MPAPPPPSATLGEGPWVFATGEHPVRVVRIATLAHPWSIAFLPDGALLVTERAGRLRIIRNDVLDPQPISGVPVVADVEIMRLLLDQGADPNINARGEITPMMVAAGLAHMDNESLVPEDDRLAAVKLTLEVGNDIHVVNANGFNVVHAAAFAGLRTVIEHLDDLGAELNLVAKNGQTPLGITEGNTLSGFFADRPDAAVLLRELGATSSGAVTLERQIEQQIERQELQEPPDPASSRDPDRDQQR